MSVRRQKKTGSPALIRVGGASFIPALLREFGLDAEAIVRRADLEPKTLENADTLIAFERLNRLLDISARETKCEHFGLLLGSRSGASYLGILHALARNSPNVGSALSNVIRYFHHHDQAAFIQLVIGGESAMLEYVTPPRSIGRDIIGDGAMAIAYALMKELAPPEWAPMNVRLTRPRPANVNPYVVLFGRKVEFNGGASALIFSRHWLEEAIPSASGRLRILIEQHLEKLDQDHSTAFSSLLRRVIVAGMASAEPTIDAAAATLGMSRRTVSRRLRHEGMVFRDVVDEVRLAMAKELLEATDASVAAIAQHLRYSEPSVFVRAFRRWTGHSPGAWRVLRRADGSSPPD